MSFQGKLGRYTAFARLLLKHRRILDSPGLGNGEAEEFAKDLEVRGATFVKLGQVLSTRGDLLPPEYLEALSRLQDRVDWWDAIAMPRWRISRWDVCSSK